MNPLHLILSICWFVGISTASVSIPPAPVTYTLTMSNTGPAIVGSNIVFKAALTSPTSAEPKDEKYFKYEWRSSVDSLTETQHADFNTRLTHCYSLLNVEPGVYNMSVRVFDLRGIGKLVAKQSQNFSITETLNGNVNLDQKLSYRNPNASADTFSTRRPVNIHLNLTDKFISSPTFSYSWYIDDELSKSTNTPDFTPVIKMDGLHNISVRAQPFPEVTDCHGYSYPKDLSEWFNSSLILKDPVKAFKVVGRSLLKLSSEVEINTSFSGSSPFWVCWDLVSNSSATYVVNETCSEPLEKDTVYKIHLDKNPGLGQYTFNITVKNDVSLEVKQHSFSITNDDYHSAAYILIPVVGGLVLVTLILAGVVYTVQYRMKLKHVETADFDFHPSVPLSLSGEDSSSFWVNLKEMFAKMFKKNHNDRGGRFSSDSGENSRLKQMRRYGSIGNSTPA